MISQSLTDIANVLFTPATLLLIGKYILGKQSDLELRVQAIEQALNGYREQAGLIEEVNVLRDILDRRKH